MGIVRIIAFVLLPIFLSAQDWPRFELYQLVQGQDSGQFIVTDSDSNLVFSDLLKLRYSPDTALIFNGDTIAIKTEVSFPTFLAGLGITIEYNSDINQYYIESLAIEDSVFNNSFSDIPKGTPLYAVGGQGRDYWSVDVADASDPNKMPVIGIAEDVLPARDWGKLLIKGHITDVPTTGLDEGAEVYVAVGGGYTDEIPKGENVIIQRLGTVIKGNKNNGSGIINLGDPVTAPNLNPDRIFIGDVDSNVTRINLYTAIKDTASVLVSDSLTNYASRTELQDTALAIRADFPTGGGDVTTAQLADTALAIRGDIPSIPITLGTQTSGNYVATATTSGAGISGSATGEGSTFTVTSNATSSVVANTIALRNAGGALYANWFTGNNFYGLSEKAAKLDPGKTINTVLFDGTQNITIQAETYISLYDGFGIKDFTWSGNTLEYVEIDTANAELKTYILNNSAGGGDVTTAQLADTALAIRADFPSQSDTSLFAWKADSIKVTSSTTDTDFPLIFSSATTTGYTDPLINSNLTYNPSTTELILESSELIVDNDGTGFSGTFKQTGTNNVTYSDGSVTGINTYYNLSEEILNIGSVSDDAYIFNPNQSGNIYIGTNNSGAPLTAMSITDDRKVGINKSSPSYTLDVSGDINYTGSLKKNGTDVNLTNSFVMSIDLNSSNSQRIMIPSIYNGCTIDYANLVTSLTSWTGSIALDIGTVSGGSYSSSSLTSWSFTSGSGAQADENGSIGHTISTNYVVQGSYSTTSGTISKTVISFSIECN